MHADRELVRLGCCIANLKTLCFGSATGVFSAGDGRAVTQIQTFCRGDGLRIRSILLLSIKPIAMLRTYEGILKGDRIRWAEDDLPVADQPLCVHITVLDDKVETEK